MRDEYIPLIISRNCYLMCGISLCGESSLSLEITLSQGDLPNNLLQHTNLWNGRSFYNITIEDPHVHLKIKFFLHLSFTHFHICKLVLSSRLLLPKWMPYQPRFFRQKSCSGHAQYLLLALQFLPIFKRNMRSERNLIFSPLKSINSL